MNVSVRDLRAFVALAERRNFTRAAEQCCLSQSAFSALIQALENSLGTRLFTRSTRRVELTPAGQVFRESAMRLLAEFDLLDLEMKDHVQLRKGRVAVAALPSLLAGWLPVVLKEFRDAHPGIATEVWDTLSDECLGLVRSGRADFALCAAGADMAGLTAESLCTDTFFVVMHKDHPLARKKSIVGADLANQPFIHLAHSTSVRQQLDAGLHPMTVNGVMELAHLASVASLVANRVGISVIPFLALFQFGSPDIVVRPLREPKIERTIYVIMQRDKPLSLAGESLLALIKKRRTRIRSELGKD
jgi:DNA-binding transcriptional LysR family regulator